MVKIRQDRKVLCTKSQNFWQKGIIFRILGFLLIWASFKCYFWVPHLKDIPGTHFHENITSQTQVINVNASLWYSKTAYFRKNEGILVKICNIHISVTIQVTRLKFGPFSLFQYEPVCQISWFPENMGFRPLLCVPVWCGISPSWCEWNILIW